MNKLDIKGLLVSEIPDLVNIICQQRQTITSLRDNIERLKRLKSTNINNNPPISTSTSTNIYQDLETKYNDKCKHIVEQIQQPSMNDVLGQLYNINESINKLQSKTLVNKQVYIDKLLCKRSYLIHKYLYDSMIAINNSEYICDKIINLE